MDDMEKYNGLGHNTDGTIIKIFDFDGTIFNSPIPNRDLWDRKDFGKLMSETETGGYGWFQNPITLDDKYIGNSDFNEDVVADVRAANEDPNTVTVLLTGRTTQYEAQVRRILETNDLYFDYYGFKPLSSGKKIYTMNFKQEFIKDIADLYEDVVRIEMWEDRRKHVERFNEYLDALELNGGVHFVKENPRYMDENLERELFEILKQDATNKGGVMESRNKAPLYHGAFLYPESHYKLLEELKDIIPEGWKHFAHHMTMLFGRNKNPDVEDYLSANIGKDVKLVAVELGISDDAIAVKIDSDVPTDNKIPHVTIATPMGGSPVKSNKITNWERLDTPISLDAKINGFYG